MKRLPTASHPVLRQMAERGVYAPDEFDAWLAERRWSWQALDRGEYGITLEQALVLFTCEDPVRWCETFLVETRTGDPWRFFEYQKPSVRSWMQNAVHQDGAEVGKTREITCLVLWGQCTAMAFSVRRPWMLVGAPQQTHLDEIILAIEEQVGAQEDGSARGSLLSHFWRKPKRTPHTMFRFLTPPTGTEPPGIGRVYFRPAGHDGEAFRGVHVNALALMDEWAKLKRAVQWSEFVRACMPGCVIRGYSVPDGDTSSDFYKATQRAVPNLVADADGMRLFHWPKTLMPAPFWSPKREAELVRLYGGRNTPGFQRNVLGVHGQAENPVWSWDTVLPNVVDVPEFRCIKLAVDNTARQLVVEVKRIELAGNDGKKIATDHWLADNTVDLEPFVHSDRAKRQAAVRAFLREHVVGASRGVFWAGADLGETNDPTEIIISEDIGGVLRDRLRLNASGMPYFLQRDFIYCLDELFGRLPHWGADLGAAGTVVVKDLQTLGEYAPAHFDERMTGFQFASVVDCIDEQGNTLWRKDADGQVAEDSEGNAIAERAPSKHWATQCISERLQVTGYAMAYDTEALTWLTNHTRREGVRWPIYAKKDDHNIDARRQQMLRKLYDEIGPADVFSSGVHTRQAA